MGHQPQTRLRHSLSRLRRQENIRRPSKPRAIDAYLRMTDNAWNRICLAFNDNPLTPAGLSGQTSS